MKKEANERETQEKLTLWRTKQNGRPVQKQKNETRKGKKISKKLKNAVFHTYVPR
jgi:hypothetical protein